MSHLDTHLWNHISSSFLRSSRILCWSFYFIWRDPLTCILDWIRYWILTIRFIISFFFPIIWLKVVHLYVLTLSLIFSKFWRMEVSFFHQASSILWYEFSIIHALSKRKQGLVTLLKIPCRKIRKGWSSEKSSLGSTFKKPSGNWNLQLSLHKSILTRS